MAERWGGPFSRGGGAAQGGPRPRPARMVLRTNMLFVFAGTLALTGFLQDPLGLLLHLLAAAAMAGAAVLTRDGVRAEETAGERPTARAPRRPLKAAGAALAGLAVALAGATGGGDGGGDGGGLVTAVLLGLLAAGLHVASFGTDPRRPRRATTAETVQEARVARVVGGAEAVLDAMAARIRSLRDRALTERVDAFAARARDLARAVEDDPRDLTGARRYLGVYLEGARAATEKFVELESRRPDPRARAQYEALLDDLSATYARRTRRMIEGDRLDLEVEIGVLRDRLSRETEPGRVADDL